MKLGNSTYDRTAPKHFDFHRFSHRPGKLILHHHGQPYHGSVECMALMCANIRPHFDQSNWITWCHHRYTLETLCENWHLFPLGRRRNRDNYHQHETHRVKFESIRRIHDDLPMGWKIVYENRRNVSAIMPFQIYLLRPIGNSNRRYWNHHARGRDRSTNVRIAMNDFAPMNTYWNGKMEERKFWWFLKTIFPNKDFIFRSKQIFERKSILRNQSITKLVTKVCKCIFTILSNVDSCVCNECVCICVLGSKFVASQAGICSQIEYIYAVRTHILRCIANANCSGI